MLTLLYFHCITELTLACRSIAKNYSHIKSVENQLADLQLQLNLTSGPKKSALEMLRRKIEAKNELVTAARQQYAAAKQASHHAYCQYVLAKHLAVVLDDYKLACKCLCCHLSKLLEPSVRRCTVAIIVVMFVPNMCT